MTQPGNEINMSVIGLGNSLAEAVQQAVEKTLNDSFQISTHIDAWIVEKGKLFLDPYVICKIDMNQSNALCGAFIMAMSGDILAYILKLNGLEDDAEHRAIDDAASEITNMVYGMVKTSLNKRGHHFTMELPVNIHEKQAMADSLLKVEKLVLPFLADGHRCHVVVAQVA